MTCSAFEGPAGSGKTYHLLEGLREHLAAYPLADGQRVLVTTYMHGSRRRLATSLSGFQGLAGRYECSTLDSVAFRWIRRWRSLAECRGASIPKAGDFDETCALAANLLGEQRVRGWVARSFPAILIDEAQDLTRERLNMIQALVGHCRIFIAGDEYQCLQEALRPNPFAEWCSAGLSPRHLSQIRRTDVNELLTAAAALRDGHGPKAGRQLRMQETPSSAVAGAFISNAVCWYSKGGTVAILAPSFTDFVHDALVWAQENRTSKGNGPIRIAKERSEKEEKEELVGKLALTATASIAAVREAVDALDAPSVASSVHAWVERQRNALGRTMLSRLEVENALIHALSNRRRFGRSIQARITAMTIYAAKNREFDGVIVVWPYQVAGSADHKRRLLYNAITRAKKWVHVLVQGRTILTAPPFK